MIYAQLNGQPTDFGGVNSDIFDGQFDTAAQQDLTYLGIQARGAPSFGPSPGEILVGHDDWSALQYAIGTDGDFADFIHLTPPDDELTFEQIALLNQSFPPVPGACPADFDDDGTVGGADLGILLLAWGQCPDIVICPGNLAIDDVVDGADLGALLLAWGDCPRK